MKALIVNTDDTLSINEIPIPSYSSKQALVKMISCGICNGTDGKLIHKKFKGFEEDCYPVMLGHEGVGEVVEVGVEVTTFKVGDKVLLPFVDADSEKYQGITSGWGAFCEYGVVHDPAAYAPGEAPECAFAQTIVPEDIDAVDAAMIVTLREVLSSIKRFGIKENNSVAIFGCGPVGMTFIKFMSMLGVHPIIAFSTSESKRKEVLSLGADYFFNSKEVQVKEEILKICPNGVQFVLDAIGMLPLINQAMEYICDAGKICCYGIAPTCEMQLNWNKAPYNWQLHFQQFPSKVEEGAVNEQIIEWIRSGKINLKDYISDYFSFDEILQAFEKLERKEIKKKGIIVYGKRICGE